MLGENAYPSISMAIRATKNKMKKTLGGCGGPPNDEATYNNQPKYSVGDGFDLDRTCGGGDFTSFGAANKSTTK